MWCTSTRDRSVGPYTFFIISALGKDYPGLRALSCRDNRQPASSVGEWRWVQGSTSRPGRREARGSAGRPDPPPRGFVRPDSGGKGRRQRETPGSGGGDGSHWGPAFIADRCANVTLGKTPPPLMYGPLRWLAGSQVSASKATPRTPVGHCPMGKSPSAGNGKTHPIGSPQCACIWGPGMEPYKGKSEKHY